METTTIGFIGLGLIAAPLQKQSVNFIRITRSWLTTGQKKCWRTRFLTAL